MNLRVSLRIVYVAGVEGGIRRLIQAARDSAHLVDKSPFSGIVDDEDARVVREQMDLVSELSGYSRAVDIYQDFSADAAKQLVFEAKFGKSSADRTRAAVEILDRAHGKPVNRQVSLTLSPSEMSVEDLRGRTERLLIDLGYKAGVSADKLIIGEGEAGKALPEPSGREGSSGQEPA